MAFVAGAGVLLGEPATGSLLAAAPPVVTVQADKPGAIVSPMLFGVFFEEERL